MYVRFQTGGGSQTVSLGPSDAPAPASCSATTSQVPLGNRPAYPGKQPPYKPDAPCYKQKLAGRQRARRRQVRAHRRGRATTAQVTSVRDKLRREADLTAVRRKLHPFGTPSGRSRRRRRPSEDGDPQAPAATSWRSSAC